MLSLLTRLVYFSDATLVDDESTTPVRRGSREEERVVMNGEKEKRQLSSSDQSELEEELASVEVEDTSSFLETLDTEVSMMVRAR